MAGLAWLGERVGPGRSGRGPKLEIQWNTYTGRWLLSVAVLCSSPRAESGEAMCWAAHERT